MLLRKLVFVEKKERKRESIVPLATGVGWKWGVAAESDKTLSAADERQWEWWRESTNQRKQPGATPGGLPVAQFSDKAEKIINMVFNGKFPDSKNPVC